MKVTPNRTRRMDDLSPMEEPSRKDAPLYCERCRRVTTHYRADAPQGDEVWICDECALIDSLVEIRTSTVFIPGHENDRPRP